MNRATLVSSLALALTALLMVPLSAAAVDGVLNFGTEATSPTFLKAFDLPLASTVAGVEVYENDRTTAATVHLLRSDADGNPDRESAVELVAGDALADGWRQYRTRFVAPVEGRVWVRVTYAFGRTAFAADAGTGPAIGYARSATAVRSPQRVSADGGEAFARLDPHLELAVHLLTGDAISAPSEMLLEEMAPDRLADRVLSCHPNPFNPRTTVHFRLDMAGPVQLRVFDLRGRLVATLLDERRPAGRHSVDWEGRDAQGRSLASGVYFVTLDAPKGRSVQRVALVQ